MTNPILVEVTRGSAVESIHRGAVAVMNAKGHVRTEEHRRKLAEANMGNQNWLGRHHTEESKLKMSKGVLEVTTDTKFPSLTAILEHYGFKMPTLRRALKTGKPIAKGVHKGLQFRYIDDSEGAA